MRLAAYTADRALRVFLLAGTVGYLACLPHDVGLADEAYLLYDAKRIGDGDVMYRDIFQFVPPLAPWVIALLYWAFGTTIATARLAVAVLHAVTAIVIFTTCRRLGVRRELAVVAAVAYVTVCQPAWPYVSWHWFSTAFMTVLLCLLVGPWPRAPRWWILPGLVDGALTAVQHQRGVVTAAGVFALVLLDHLIGGRFSRPEPWRHAAERLAYFLVGVTLVMAPVLFVCIGTAGFDNVYDALVRYPLGTYRAVNVIAWGDHIPLAERYAAATFPALLAYAPLVLVVPVAQFVVGLVAGTGRERLRTRLVLLVSSGTAIASIWYYPDVIHIAIIGPVFLVCAADALEWAIGRIWPTSLAAGGAIAAMLLAGMLVRLQHNAAAARSEFPIAHDTAFGRVDFSTRWEPVFVDKVRELLRQTSSGEIFCYPNISSFYLLTGGRNPTPYNLLYPSSPPSQFRHILSTLDARRVPYVITAPFLLNVNDPIARYVSEHYTAMSLPEVTAMDELVSFWIYRRNDVSRPGGG